MRSAKQRCRLSIAVFAAVLLPGLASAQTQPATVQQDTTPQPGSGTTPRSGAAANSPAANPSPESSGASSWSAGRGSFGARNAMPGAVKGDGGVNQRRHRGRLRLFKLGCRTRKFRIESATRRNLAREFGILCNRARTGDELSGKRGVRSRRIAQLHRPEWCLRDKALPYAARSCRGLALIGRRA